MTSSALMWGHQPTAWAHISLPLDCSHTLLSQQGGGCAHAVKPRLTDCSSELGLDTHSSWATHFLSQGLDIWDQGTQQQGGM